jgi:hypothetical protein
MPMKVIFSTSVAGLNFDYRPKREYDLPDEVARSFIQSGQAAEVRPVRRRGGKLVETAQRVVDTFRG